VKLRRTCPSSSADDFGFGFGFGFLGDRWFAEFDGAVLRRSTSAAASIAAFVIEWGLVTRRR
jgi:hypothetical protein